MSDNKNLLPVVKEHYGRMRNYIDGEFVESTSDRAGDVINPATAEVIATVPLSTKDEVTTAVDAAQDIYQEWRETPPNIRVQPIYRLKALFEKHYEELARIVTQEHGKVIDEARGSVRRMVDNLEFACGIPSLMMGENLEDGAAPGIDEEFIRQPLGVFAAVAPFNFPAMVPFWFWPSAVACGNTFVVKPSEQVPITQDRIFEIIDDAGFPPGVINMVHGDKEAVDALLDDTRVQGISFVGSTPIARYIYERAAQTGKRVQCQGGAKNFLTLMPDANLDACLPNVVSSCLGNSGQRCLAGAVLVIVGDDGDAVVDRIVAAAKASGVKEIFIHAFLDGRDTDPKSGEGYVGDLVKKLDEIGAGQVATVCGRYWAMDRDKRWDRVNRAWDMLTKGQGAVTATDPVQAINESYAAGTTDEFLEPTVITNPEGTPTGVIGAGDSVFFWNFRADRARELTWAFKQDDFDGFDVTGRPQVGYLTMTPYDEKMDLPAMFRPEFPRNGLAEIFAREGIRNLRAAETEKYAHVTYFFNGGREEPFDHETRELIPSPKVATYDLQPEMSAPEVAAVVERACQGGQYDVVVVNFANGDMVGHTGIFDAAVSAVQTLDRLLEQIMPPSLEQGTTWLITADHGNCDEMIGPDGRPFTQHSLNRVPFIVAGNAFADPENTLNSGDFGLADIAPTVLQLLGIEQPAEMTGHSIIKKNQES